MPLRNLLVGLCLLCAAVPAASLAEPIDPPFGFKWGQSSDAVKGVIDNSKAELRSRDKLDGLDVWVIEKLPQTGLKRSLLKFRDDALVEVELQYQQSNWSSRQYRVFMAQARKKIEAKLGSGDLIARSQIPVENDITQTIIGYEWSRPNSQLQLFFYSATNGSQSFHTVSLHYKSG